VSELTATLLVTRRGALIHCLDGYLESFVPKLSDYIKGAVLMAALCAGKTMGCGVAEWIKKRYGGGGGGEREREREGEGQRLTTLPLYRYDMHYFVGTAKVLIIQLNRHMELKQLSAKESKLSGEDGGSDLILTTFSLSLSLSLSLSPPPLRSLAREWAQSLLHGPFRCPPVCRHCGSSP